MPKTPPARRRRRKQSNWTNLAAPTCQSERAGPRAGSFCFWGALSIPSRNVMTSSGNVMTSSGNVMTRSGNVMTRSGNVMTRSGNVMTRSGNVTMPSAYSDAEPGPRVRCFAGSGLVLGEDAAATLPRLLRTRGTAVYAPAVQVRPPCYNFRLAQISTPRETFAYLRLTFA